MAGGVAAARSRRCAISARPTASRSRCATTCSTSPPTRATLGKPVGNDLRERKMTRSVNSRAGTPEDREFRDELSSVSTAAMTAAPERPRSSAASSPSADRSGGLAKTREAIAGYVERAKTSLDAARQRPGPRRIRRHSPTPSLGIAPHARGNVFHLLGLTMRRNPIEIGDPGRIGRAVVRRRQAAEARAQRRSGQERVHGRTGRGRRRRRARARRSAPRTPKPTARRTTTVSGVGQPTIVTDLVIGAPRCRPTIGAARLNRVRPRRCSPSVRRAIGTRARREWDQKEMPFTEHLRELRNRLFVSHRHRRRARGAALLAVAVRDHVADARSIFGGNVTLHAFGPGRRDLGRSSSSRSTARSCSACRCSLYQTVDVRRAGRPSENAPHGVLRTSRRRSLLALGRHRVRALLRASRACIDVAARASPTRVAEATFGDRADDEHRSCLLFLAFAIVFQTPVVMRGCSRASASSTVAMLRKYRALHRLRASCVGGGVRSRPTAARSRCC